MRWASIVLVAVGSCTAAEPPAPPLTRVAPVSYTDLTLPTNLRVLITVVGLYAQ